MANAAPVAKKKPASFDVLALRRALGHGVPVARPVLAKLLGMHVNSIANLEHGSVPSAKTRKKLEEIAAKADSGKLSVSKPKRAAPGKAGKVKKAAVAPQKALKKGKTASGSIDVAALRAGLGISRARFARLLGAVPESVRLWEHGRPPSEKFVPKLRSLAAQGAKAPALTGTATQAPKRGRPPGRLARSAPIVGEVPVVYADVVGVVRSGESTRIRFGLTVPGEKGARVVADVVVTGQALGRLK